MYVIKVLAPPFLPSAFASVLIISIPSGLLDVISMITLISTTGIGILLLRPIYHCLSNVPVQYFEWRLSPSLIQLQKHSLHNHTFGVFYPLFLDIVGLAD